ncbi:MAG: hypothetical protein GYA12_14095 [Chloroflexi bacterium]|nr:hypothetical protein [Chloroflexota bacterium]
MPNIAEFAFFGTICTSYYGVSIDVAVTIMMIVREGVDHSPFYCVRVNALIPPKV